MFPQVLSEHDGHERKAAEEFALANLLRFYTYAILIFALNFVRNRNS